MKSSKSWKTKPKAAAQTTAVPCVPLMSREAGGSACFRRAPLRVGVNRSQSGMPVIRALFILCLVATAGLGAEPAKLRTLAGNTLEGELAGITDKNVQWRGK